MTDEGPNVTRQDRIEVAVRHEDVGDAPDRRLRDPNRVPRAQLLTLLDEDGLRRDPPGRHLGAHVVGGVTDDDHDAVGACGERGLDDVPERGPAADRMQDLRAGGPQPLALPGREDHRSERARHASPSRSTAEA
jgi:hypothetical protein